MFTFRCEICETKQIDVDQQFTLDAWEFDSPEMGSYFFDVEKMCECCANEIKDAVDAIRAKHGEQ